MVYFDMKIKMNGGFFEISNSRCAILEKQFFQVAIATVAMTKILSIHFVGFSSLVIPSHILPLNLIMLAHNPFYKFPLQICCYDNSCHLSYDFSKNFEKGEVSSIIYCQIIASSCNYHQKYFINVSFKEVMN